jgi:spermidine/putrescine transport system permease protein
MTSKDGYSHQEAAGHARLGVLLSTPAVLVLLVLFVAPVALFLVYSFLQGGTYQVTAVPTLENYREALGDSSTWRLTYNAVLTGLLTGVLCLVMGVPLAYVTRFKAGRFEYPLLFLVVVELFVSYLVRIYAWRAILAEHGAIAPVLEIFGIAPGSLLYTRAAVVIALVHIYVPYVALVTYAALRNVPATLLELSADLGANSYRRWTRVVIPLAAPAMVTAFLYTFVLAASDYVTPQFLGGIRGSMVGLKIQQSFTQFGDYPLGAAMSMLVLVIFFLAYLALNSLLRVTGLDKVEIRQ